MATLAITIPSESPCTNSLNLVSILPLTSRNVKRSKWNGTRLINAMLNYIAFLVRMKVFEIFSIFLFLTVFLTIVHPHIAPSRVPMISV